MGTHAHSGRLIALDCGIDLGQGVARDKRKEGTQGLYIRSMSMIKGGWPPFHYYLALEWILHNLEGHREARRRHIGKSQNKGGVRAAPCAALPGLGAAMLGCTT